MATLITHFASHEITLKQVGNTLIVNAGKLKPLTLFMSNSGRLGHSDINFPATLQNLAS